MWGQFITTLPTKRIPKKFTWGSGTPEEFIPTRGSLVEDGSSGSLSQDVKRTGQILWIRGLTRLQTQVCLIQLHNQTMSQAQHQAQQLALNKRLSITSPTSPTTGIQFNTQSCSASASTSNIATSASTLLHNPANTSTDENRVTATGAGSSNIQSSSGGSSGRVRRAVVRSSGDESKLDEIVEMHEITNRDKEKVTVITTSSRSKDTSYNANARDNLANVIVINNGDGSDGRKILKRKDYEEENV